MDTPVEQVQLSKPNPSRPSQVSVKPQPSKPNQSPPSLMVAMIVAAIVIASYAPGIGV